MSSHVVRKRSDFIIKVKLVLQKIPTREREGRLWVRGLLSLFPEYSDAYGGTGAGGWAQTWVETMTSSVWVAPSGDGEGTRHVFPVPSPSGPRHRRSKRDRFGPPRAGYLTDGRTDRVSVYPDPLHLPHQHLNRHQSS